MEAHETVLYNFTGSNGDGLEPLGPLVAETSGLTGQAGVLFGVTAGGGSSAGVCGPVGGCGAIFQLKRLEPGQTAWTETLPFAAFVESNGSTPAGGLLLRSSPNTLAPIFFGTTLYGGSAGSTASASSGYGTVFSVAGNSLTTLWNFTGGADGRSPSGALIADDAAGITGAMYGTTRGFKKASYGTVFRVENSVAGLSTIWTFSGSDGQKPTGALLADQTGAVRNDV